MKRRNVTIRDVARVAGVSVSTVSVAVSGRPGVSEARRAQIIKVAKEMGYQPDRAAASIRAERSHSLGVVVTLEQSFQVSIVDELYQQATQLGYRIVLAGTTPNKSETECAQDLIAERCDGLILIGSNLSSAALAELSQRIPLAVICAQWEAPAVDCLMSADEEGISQAVQYLLGQGYRSIAYLHAGNEARSAVRQESYKAAMTAAGLAEQIRVLTGGNSLEGGGRVAEELLAQTEPGAAGFPQAVLAFNDMSAMGFCLRMLKGGFQIPGDVAVVGFDDAPISRFSYLPLTTIQQNPKLLVEAALRRLIQHLDQIWSAPRFGPGKAGDWQGQVIKVPVRMIFRETA